MPGHNPVWLDSGRGNESISPAIAKQARPGNQNRLQTSRTAAQDISDEEEKGRALGKSLIVSLMTSDSEDAVLAAKSWTASELVTEDEDDFDYLYDSGFLDPLSDLTEDEANFLIERL